MDHWFALASLLVAPFWALLIFAPRWRVTVKIAESPWIAAPAALAYLVLILPRIGAIAPTIMHPSLPGVAALLGSPVGAFLGWAHFLAFDLFMGRWIFLEARRDNLSSLLISPILYLTLMFGPIGFLTFLMLRAAVRSWRAGQIRRSVASVLQALNASTPLMLLFWFNVALIGAATAGLVLDHRIITGAPAWLKPLKFAISVAIYSATLAWTLSFLPAGARIVRALSWTMASMVGIEMVIIPLQAFRGTTSHFNHSTPLDTVLFGVMGIAITVLWVAQIVASAQLLRTKIADRALALGIRLGSALTVVGMTVGFLMTAPTAAQMASAAALHVMPVVGAHTVGAPDGGAGLPFLGWSTRAGDLRVAHFVGLHALQLLPLAALLLGLSRWSETVRLRLVGIFGAGYLGAIGLLVWQALRGESIVRPDGATLGLWSVLSVAVLLIAIIAIFQGRHEVRTSAIDAGELVGQGGG
ncbi:hypothetical protein CCAX7_64210 [Capsulimonas corticalis]|uniref:Uncharacterized protein n=1 Tax=Capsulimonas corticalis TaxID=2219043 RepID=A0A402CQJ1_9BACT|nr:ABA4-like family protein [Capsulimonas corticalis]BDI34370.1 hypothetical protein CCAX7_64210 [Capsulimonas corticalis]